MEKEIYDVLRRHKLSLKKREAIMKDLATLGLFCLEIEDDSEEEFLTERDGFKLGDKVRVTGLLHGHGFKIGEEVIITEVCPTDFTCKNNQGHEWYLQQTEFEKL